MSGNEYVCTLDAASVKKAREELHEDPNDREHAVQALRAWIQAQPHLNYRTDTNFLLQILRTRKFSQLDARAMIETNLNCMQREPQWFRDIDTHDPRIQAVFDTGVFFPLPGRDDHGQKVFFSMRGNLDPDSKIFNHVDDFIRTALCVHILCGREDMTQVNGVVHFFDLSTTASKHNKGWTLDVFRRVFRQGMGNFPGRFKGFHYYNGGPFMDFVMMVFKKFLPKKYSERLYLHGKSLESLYNVVPMRMLPIEYLPDDYDGPNGGTVREIIDGTKKQLMADDFRKEMLHYTSRDLWIDDSKKPQETMQMSFRKLNVD